ncbi:MULTISPECIES: hypothetical protein [Pseudomonas]|uniref:hypothetical protein n=1 Tax=Pseudomonas TaxID=286 RepID=UPI0018E7C19B|nr:MULTISPECIES: hypothetical protein [Pseudomonas]MBW9237088.1 hypothetical protein [Pseudomonas carnis]
MLAKNVNDDACFLDKRGACEFFASKLAPRGLWRVSGVGLQAIERTVGEGAGHVDQATQIHCGSWLACDG